MLGRPASEAVAETADRMVEAALADRRRPDAGSAGGRCCRRPSQRRGDPLRRCVLDGCARTCCPALRIRALPAHATAAEPRHRCSSAVGGARSRSMPRPRWSSTSPAAAGVDDEPGFDGMRIRVGADGTRVVPAIKDPPLRQVIVPTTLSGAEFSNLGGCADPLRKVRGALYRALDAAGRSLHPRSRCYGCARLPVSGFRPASAPIDHASRDDL